MFKTVALLLLGASASASEITTVESTALDTSNSSQIPTTTSAKPSNSTLETTPTSSKYEHHKQFSFDYGSTSNDDLEVDVEIQTPGLHFDDDPDYEDPYAQSSIVKRFIDSDSEIEASAKGEDVVWVTRYTGGTKTLPVPSTTITETVTGTTTAITTASIVSTYVEETTATQLSTTTTTLLLTVPEWQTATITKYGDGVTATVTATVITSVTEPVTEPGSIPAAKITQSALKATEVDCSAQNEQVFQLGYVNGADWGYTVGYNDAARGRPFMVPSFATGVRTPPAAQTPAYTQSFSTPPPPSHPLPPPPPPSALPTAPPQSTPASYEPLSYTTISYWVPDGYGPGYGSGYGPGYGPGYGNGPYRGEVPYKLDLEDPNAQSIDSENLASTEAELNNAAVHSARLNVFDATSPNEEGEGEQEA